MSSCDTFMITCSALFTRDLYQKFWVPNKPDAHYTKVGRIAAVVFVVCGVLVAFNLTDVIAGLQIFWKISTVMGVAWVVGLFWRRATVAGAWAGSIVTLALIAFTSRISIGTEVFWDFNAVFAESMRGTWLDFVVFVNAATGTVKLTLPWQMIIYLTGGVVTTVLVSLVTSAVPATRLDRFYACMRTPVDKEEAQGRPFTLPKGLEPAPRNVVVDVWGLEIPRPRRSSAVGFVICWGVVAAIIGGTYLIFRLA